MGVGDGPNECGGRWRIGLAVRLRADLSTRSKRGLCWPRASRNGERHWADGSAVTASLGVDPDRCCSGGGATFRLVAASEGLDDDHAAAAAATRTRQYAVFVCGCGR